MKVMRKVVEVNARELYDLVNKAVKEYIGEGADYELANLQTTVNALIFDEPDKVQEVELMSVTALEEQVARFSKPGLEVAV